MENNKEKYKSIIHIVKDYLSIGASAANIERIWSKAGQIITKKRNSLSSKTFNMLLFGYCHIDLFDRAVKILFQKKNLNKSNFIGLNTPGNFPSSNLRFLLVRVNFG